MPMFDTFKRVTEFKETRRKLRCHGCHQDAIHTLEALCEGQTEEDIGPNESMDWGTDYQIFRCGNCDAVSFLASSWHSGDIEPDDYGRGYMPRYDKQYPTPTSADFTFNVEFIPKTLDSLLDEMLYALAGGKLRLATIALRMCVEFIVKDAKCTGRDLAKKIDNLRTRDLIDDDQRDLLHKIRQKGNASAHEAQAMHKGELVAGMGIVELLLEAFYNAPGRKARLVGIAKNQFGMGPDEIDF
ncbi:DUF4145 domain-containing protein [Sphingomonas sp. CGMCC 1.13654]|uniref:DUF4145 domain-containing protein n=1 Tax=Sphingomonas chungangi TaxID=2683589 RepID=A0A838L7K5_9SPHN|nr:DUF4145 domain-containing protein [Sphingomonas chungangi]MBA2935301.1 DUF4145 domain-containing protein [Sphingomonas chungangi]